MAKNDVVRYRAKQWNARSDQHRHARDHQSADTSGREESLNRDPAIYVSVLEAARFELPYDFGRFTRHLLDHPFVDRRKIKRTTAQYNYRLLFVKRLTERQYNFEGLAADHDDIDAGIEVLETVRLLLTRMQEIEGVVWPSKKTIDAHSAED
jgi:hypothetical protein